MATDRVRRAAEAVLASLSNDNYEKTARLARTRLADKHKRNPDRGTFDVRIPRYKLADLINALEDQ